MPVLESTDNVLPRSALRHRLLDEGGKRSIVTTAAHPVVQRASRIRPKPADDDLISEWKRVDVEEEEEEEEDERDTTPGLQPLYHPDDAYRPIQRPAAVQQPSVQRTRPKAHPLIFLGLGMLVTFLLWQLLSASVTWWNNTMNYIHYGYPRTFQMDAVVGHDDSTRNPSHFIATNLHGHIEIIEFPGGDGSQTRTYSGPQLFGPDADTAPVTLKFADVNGDHRPDMLIFFQSSWIVFINDPGGFRSPTDQERQDAIQYLATHGQS